jgi:hypothetical protein
MSIGVRNVVGKKVGPLLENTAKNQNIGGNAYHTYDDFSSPDS